MTKENKGNIVIYEGKDGNIELRADVEKDTIWATQAQIAQLFDVNSQAITKHLANIYSEEELVKDSTCSKMEQVQKEGGRLIKRIVEFYNLDAIIAVGYRVSSKKATQFRIWATRILREYLTGGYSLNKYKLEKSPKALLELYKAMALIDSSGLGGKLKGKVTIKLTEDFDPHQ